MFWLRNAGENSITHSYLLVAEYMYSKRPFSKRKKIGFQDQLSLNAGQKYCRMLQGIRLQFVIEIFILSFFEWPFYTGLLYIPEQTYGITKASSKWPIQQG